jgi:cell division protease FtsH
MDDACDLESLARRTAGFAGADLANLVNEAALAAARARREKVTPADLDQAFDRVILGARRRLALSDDDRRRVAVHEGGHALVAFLTPGADPLEKVTIVPHGRALGVTQFTNDDRLNLPESYVRARLAVALGGRAAERVVLNEISSGAENDIEAATAYAHRMVEKWGMGEELGPVAVERDGYAAAPPGAGSNSPELATLADREVRRILREADEQADQVLRRHQAQLARLADLLVERETIDRAEVEALVGLREP